MRRAPTTTSYGRGELTCLTAGDEDSVRPSARRRRLRSIAAVVHDVRWPPRCRWLRRRARLTRRRTARRQRGPGHHEGMSRCEKPGPAGCRQHRTTFRSSGRTARRSRSARRWHRRTRRSRGPFRRAAGSLCGSSEPSACCPSSSKSRSWGRTPRLTWWAPLRRRPRHTRRHQDPAIGQPSRCVMFAVHAHRSGCCERAGCRVVPLLGEPDAAVAACQ